MEMTEKAKLYALIKILGCNLDDDDIIKQLEAHYETMLIKLNENRKPPTATVFSRNSLGL